MITARYSLKNFFIKGAIFVFRGRNERCLIRPVDKYSLTPKTWCQVASMHDDRGEFCVCPFNDKIFLFGGRTNSITRSFCLQLDTNDYSWKEVSRMNEARSNSACAVYEERIVVCGGFNFDQPRLKTVECHT